MIEHIELMFTDLELMLRKLKKPSYEANMNRFRNEQGHFIDEMIRYVHDGEDREKAVSEISEALPSSTGTRL